jgi:hypothetical protein
LKKYNYILLPLFIIYLIFTSCSRNYLFDRDQKDISKKLKMIAITDQSVRKNITGIDSRYNLITANTLIDSFYIFDDNKWKNMDLSKVNAINDQLKKLKPEAKTDYLREVNNSVILLNQVDSINRIALYNIIKKYGYPSYDLRKWKNDSLKVGIAFVLTHTDPKSKSGKKLLNLMIEEYYHERVDEGTMRQFLWHVEGREGEIDRNTSVNKWIEKVKNSQKK